MATATDPRELMEVAGARYGTLALPPITLDRALYSGLGTRDEAHTFVGKTGPLLAKTVLYIVGRDNANRLNEQSIINLPQSFREAGDLVYAECQERKGRGHWHDVVEFLPRDQSPKGHSQPQGNCALTRWFTGAKELKRVNSVWRPVDAEDIIFPVWVPVGDEWFAVPTKDGLVDPRTGSYLELVKDREEAVKRYVRSGFTQKQAEKELSRQWGAGEKGIRVVYSYSDGDGGPLYVSFGDGPESGSEYLGSFPASRLASGASRDSELVPQAEYQAAVRESREAVQRAEIAEKELARLKESGRKLFE